MPIVPPTFDSSQTSFMSVFENKINGRGDAVTDVFRARHAV
ncbi:MAG: hypothetical protein ACI9VS_000998, partial [Candidatus Binatia bacterium]